MNKLIISLITSFSLIVGTPAQDVINYQEPPRYYVPPIFIAPDSARYEPRWLPMLDDKDMKRLIFLIYSQQNYGQAIYIQK